MEKRRIFGLDLLRMCSLLLVVGYHATDETAGLLTGMIWSVVQRGYQGVSIFFVLSGWLVSGLIFESMPTQGGLGASAVLTFWTGRWFKTLPPFFALLAVHALLWQFGCNWLGASPTAEDWKLILTFRGNWIQDHASPFPVLWSLAVEEQAYLLLPLILALLYAVPRRVRTVLLIGTVCFAPAMRAALWMQGGSFSASIYPMLSTRLDQFAIPILLRAAMKYQHPVWQYIHAQKERFAALGAILLLILRFAENNDTLLGVTTGFTIYAIGVTLLLPALHDWKTVPVKWSWLGKALTAGAVGTYAMYLVHSVGIGIARRTIFEPSLTRMAVSVALGAVFATLMYRLVEKPALKLLKLLKSAIADWWRARKQVPAS